MSSPLLTGQFDYPLPEELIATAPSDRRDGARLLVLDRQTGAIQHRHFTDLPELLRPSDLLILNDTRVRPSVLRTADGALEFTLLEETSPRNWVCLALPGRKARPGMTVSFRPRDWNGPEIRAQILKTLPEGERVLRFFGDFAPGDYADLQLPPYIKKQRALLAEEGHPVQCDDTERYQTIYAREEGSVAAPTAGLHFTPELLARFRHAFLTLHVGLGTFRPVKTKLVSDHTMHDEAFEVPSDLAEKVQDAQRIVAVGTTTVRVLESIRNWNPRTGRTRLFIYPPYTFRNVNALITNFHLPQSTLLMMVCAFAGTESVMAAYREAIAEKYQFFSYGDAMLIL